MRGYPKFSFSISITLVKICISRIITNRGKNTFALVGTVLKLLLLALEDKIRVPAWPGNWKLLINDTATKISSHNINSRYFNRFVTFQPF